ncbi:MAG: hypothetical protein HQK83_04850 [Fibrobacteria bacterium]|nr:hypothetical protein [Fibrobacteria bacterium]
MKAKKLFIFIFMVSAMVSMALAQDETEESFKKSTIYIHPVGLILSGIPGLTWITATYENDFAPYKAFLLRPSYMGIGEENDNMKSFSLGFGIRNYLSKPQSGIYLDITGNLGYSTVHLEDEYSNDAIEGSGIYIAGLGYIGVRGKWEKVSIFIDIGGGYQYSGASAEDSYGNEASFGGGMPALDVNFGIGFNL